MMTLAEHMKARIGVSIPDPIMDGRWHSGRGNLDKISYVGHHLPKGTLVRYRHWGQGDHCHEWREWDDGCSEHLPAGEYERRKAEAAARATEAERQAELEYADLLEVLEQIISEADGWDKFYPNEHRYLKHKRILALHGFRPNGRYGLPHTDGHYIDSNSIVIPIRDDNANLIGIQQITSGGSKIIRGRAAGGHLWIGGGLTTGEVKGRIYIAEGWATGCSIHMRTRNPVVVAFSAGNLLSVGQTIREHYPGAEIVFAADNDTGKLIKVDGKQIENPGVYYASKAAEAVGAGVIIPTEYGDWNDWHTSLIVDKKKPDHF